jgi:hypothetical protein
MPTLGRKPVSSSTIIAIAITPWKRRAASPWRTTFSVPPPTAAPPPLTNPAGAFADMGSRFLHRGRSTRWTMQNRAPATIAT